MSVRLISFENIVKDIDRGFAYISVKTSSLQLAISIILLESFVIWWKLIISLQLSRYCYIIDAPWDSHKNRESMQSTSSVKTAAGGHSSRPSYANMERKKVKFCRTEPIVWSGHLLLRGEFEPACWNNLANVFYLRFSGYLYVRTFYAHITQMDTYLKRFIGSSPYGTNHINGLKNSKRLLFASLHT